MASISMLGRFSRAAKCSNIFMFSLVSLPLKAFQRIPQYHFPRIGSHPSCISLLGIPHQRAIHLSAPRADLMEFFDDKENWSEESVKVGRPWKMDELRLKSNTDLHKLWYVLLKERNVIMTMEAEYKETCELFPAPERLEKVEESMENLLDVVAERERAYNLIQTGDDGEPKPYPAINVLGRTFNRRPKEHFLPKHANPNYRRGRVYKWQVEYLKLFRERTREQRSQGRNRAKKRREELGKVFPDSDV